jgi:hypothetical protein
MEHEDAVLNIFPALPENTIPCLKQLQAIGKDKNCSLCKKKLTQKHTDRQKNVIEERLRHPKLKSTIKNNKYVMHKKSSFTLEGSEHSSEILILVFGTNT